MLTSLNRQLTAPNKCALCVFLHTNFDLCFQVSRLNVKQYQWKLTSLHPKGTPQVSFACNRDATSVHLVLSYAVPDGVLRYATPGYTCNAGESEDRTHWLVSVTCRDLAATENHVVLFSGLIFLSPQWVAPKIEMTVACGAVGCRITWSVSPFHPCPRHFPLRCC